MGGTCPSRARAAPVGGWYRDGRNWVYVEIKVVITGVAHRPPRLRGSGTMRTTADDMVMVVHFDHLQQNRPLAGHIQPNGDIKWPHNNKEWVRDKGAWPAPVASYDPLPNHFDAHGTSTGDMKKSRSCHF